LNWQISRISAFVYRNWIFALKNMFAVVEIFFWPIIGIVSIGLMAGFLKLEQKYLNFLITGAVMSGVLQVSQLDVAYGFLYDVWGKSLKQTYIAPVRNYDFIIGSWIVGVVRGTIAFVVLYFLAHWWFGFNLPPAAVIVFSLLGVSLTAMIIGMTVIFFIMSFGSRIDVIAWMLSVLMMLVCGIYYPVTYLPPWLTRVAEFIPLTYFLEYYRSGYGFPLSFSHPLLKGFGLSFIYIVLAYGLIEVAYNRARKTGMILKLSE
jgi:ABC-2 type transport system permease protein